jgi:hypothetical protein
MTHTTPDASRPGRDLIIRTPKRIERRCGALKLLRTVGITMGLIALAACGGGAGGATGSTSSNAGSAASGGTTASSPSTTTLANTSWQLQVHSGSSQPASLPVILSFLPDGSTYIVAYEMGSGSDQQGIELASYTFDSSSGAIATACPKALTGPGWFSQGFGSAACQGTTATASITGNTLTVTESEGGTATYTQVVFANGTIDGTWYESNSSNGGVDALTFLANGTYVTADAGGNFNIDGIQVGTYTYNSASGTVTIDCPTVNTEAIVFAFAGQIDPIANATECATAVGTFSTTGLVASIGSPTQTGTFAFGPSDSIALTLVGPGSSESFPPASSDESTLPGLDPAVVNAVNSPYVAACQNIISAATAAGVPAQLYAYVGAACDYNFEVKYSPTDMVSETGAGTTVAEAEAAIQGYETACQQNIALAQSLASGAPTVSVSSAYDTEVALLVSIYSGQTPVLNNSPIGPIYLDCRAIY